MCSRTNATGSSNLSLEPKPETTALKAEGKARELRVSSGLDERKDGRNGKFPRLTMSQVL